MAPPDTSAGEAGGAVTVLFFAGAREATGVARSTFSCAPGAVVAELAEQLRSRYGPQLEAVLPICAIWVNGSPATPATILRPGDEVGLLPPVSGG